LEVSSPGIGEPLKQHRQYVKNIGREVEVLLAEDNRTVTGKLLLVTDESITVEKTEGKGKKQVISNEELPITNIKQTKVLIKF
jgi:ribosome maturation factor RimP